jgi:hypothetical protein
MLSIRYSGDGANHITGTGVSPPLEKPEHAAEQREMVMTNGAVSESVF